MTQIQVTDYNIRKHKSIHKLIVNYWITTLICLGFNLVSLADSFRLEGLQGNKYYPSTNTEIVWAATNEIPNGLWTYKVVPQNVSMAVVSNLMSLCGFEWANLTKKQDADVPDKNLIRFVDKKENWTRYLEIAPTFGWIEYHADSNSKVSVEYVPNSVDAGKLALDVLFQMGIDRSLLCDKHEHLTVRGELSHEGQKMTTNVISRGISYSRQIDGVESRNSACFIIDFESHSRITHFWLNWRNLLP